jgi:hypothetical protein
MGLLVRGDWTRSFDIASGVGVGMGEGASDVTSFFSPDLAAGAGVGSRT